MKPKKRPTTEKLVEFIEEHQPVPQQKIVETLYTKRVCGANNDEKCSELFNKQQYFRMAISRALSELHNAGRIECKRETPERGSIPMNVWSVSE